MTANRRGKFTSKDRSCLPVAALQVNGLHALFYIVAGKTQAHSGKSCKPSCNTMVQDQNTTLILHDYLYCNGTDSFGN
jgi:hypothetical protein